MTIHSCTFTGRRLIDEKNIITIKKYLAIEVRQLIKNGYYIFLVGGAIGFDTIAAQVVMEMKKEFDFIKLILVLPSPEYSSNWNECDKIVFDDIKLQCNEVVYTSTKKIRGCNHIRNRYLIDNSNVCIAFKNSETGGSAYTVNYAQKKLKQVVNIADHFIK